MMRCDVCSVGMNSTFQYLQHMQGKSHTKKLRQKELQENPPPPPPPKPDKPKWVPGGHRGRGDGNRGRGDGSRGRGGGNQGRGRPIVGGGPWRGGGAAGAGGSFMRGGRIKRGRGGPINFVPASNASTQGQQTVPQPAYQFDQQAQQPAFQPTQQTHQPAYQFGQQTQPPYQYDQQTQQPAYQPTQQIQQPAYQPAQQTQPVYQFGQQIQPVYQFGQPVMDQHTYQYGQAETAYQYGQQAEQSYGTQYGSMPAGVQGSQQQNQKQQPKASFGNSFPKKPFQQQQPQQQQQQQQQQQWQQQQKQQQQQQQQQQQKPSLGNQFPSFHQQQQQQQEPQSSDNNFPSQQKGKTKKSKPPRPVAETITNDTIVFGDNMGVVSVSLKESNPLYCEICFVKLTSPEQAEIHYRGARHIKRAKVARLREIGAVVEEEGKKPENGFFFCGFCNITVNSEAQMEIHRSGAKHIKMVDQRKRHSDVTMETDSSPKKTLSSSDPSDIPHVDPSEIKPFKEMFPVSSSTTVTTGT